MRMLLIGIMVGAAGAAVIGWVLSILSWDISIAPSESIPIDIESVPMTYERRAMLIDAESRQVEV